MPSPISDHTVPWPKDAADEYVAEGYWAGVTLGTLLREVAAQPARGQRPHRGRAGRAG